MEISDGRGARFAHRRPELLRAAADHVLDHGVSGLSLRPLGAALGVSHVSLLHHFGSREQLFVEVLRELREREREQLARQAAALAGDAGLEVLLRDAWVRLSDPGHEPFLRLLFELVGRALQDPDGYGPFFQELADDWTGTIEALLRARGAGQEEAAALAVCVYGSVRGLLLDLVATGRRDRAQAGFEQLATLLRPRFAELEGTVSALALGLYVLFLLLLFGLRSVVQRRRTGSSGWRGISGRPGSAEWLGGVLFAVALLLGLAAPLLALLGVVEPVAALDVTAAHVAGLVLVAAGTALTLAAQLAMGDSWRIGVDAAERTELVTGGPFAIVRNPFFAAMLPAALGFALLIPSAVSLAGLLALAAALELQTRVVEEPYLRHVHGGAYAAYAARTGRFLPGVGRLRG